MSRKHWLVRSASFCSGPLPSMWTAIQNTFRPLLDESYAYFGDKAACASECPLISKHRKTAEQKKKKSALKSRKDEFHSHLYIFFNGLKNTINKRFQHLIVSLNNKHLFRFGHHLHHCAAQLLRSVEVHLQWIAYLRREINVGYQSHLAPIDFN